MRANQSTLENHADGRAQKRLSQHNPEIVVMPDQKMAVVHTVGDPDRLLHLVLPALYSSVYELDRKLHETGRDFRIGHLRARWLDTVDVRFVPRDEWRGTWGLPIPDDVTALPQTPMPRRLPHAEVEIETWEYGTIAQLAHAGPSSEEGPDIEHLRDFIGECGYEIAGPLEEEYVAGPAPSFQKIVVRYPVRRSTITISVRSAMLYGLPW